MLFPLFISAPGEPKPDRDTDRSENDSSEHSEAQPEVLRLILVRRNIDPRVFVEFSPDFEGRPDEPEEELEKVAHRSMEWDAREKLPDGMGVSDGD